MRLSRISLRSSPYDAAPQLSAKVFPSITIRLVYITATPAPLSMNRLSRYSHRSENMKCRP